MEPSAYSDSGSWPADLITPRRAITGMSAMLLPLRDDGSIDWAGWEQHLVRTQEAGLIPAVNMDTGFAALITPAQRR
ncbi:MAG: hypothetical protein RIS70_3854, partial [Planctomycetota bacterium]